MTWKQDMTRAEHLEWCRERAMREYNFYRAKDPAKGVEQATRSMVSDVRKHPEALLLMMDLFIKAQTVTDEAGLVKFLESVK